MEQTGKQALDATAEDVVENLDEKKYSEIMGVAFAEVKIKPYQFDFIAFLGDQSERVKGLTEFLEKKFGPRKYDLNSYRRIGPQAYHYLLIPASKYYFVAEEIGEKITILRLRDSEKDKLPQELLTSEEAEVKLRL